MSQCHDGDYAARYLTPIVLFAWLQVKLLRLKKKAHLIKARMAGMAASTGDILLFQDGHTEVSVVRQFTLPLDSADYCSLT